MAAYWERAANPCDRGAFVQSFHPQVGALRRISFSLGLISVDESPDLLEITKHDENQML